jgi:hypothetical protein
VVVLVIEEGRKGRGKNVPRCRISINQTRLINFEPSKSSRIHNTAITRTFGQIRKHRPFMKANHSTAISLYLLH